MKTVLFAVLSLSLSLAIVAPPLARAADPETAKPATKKDPKQAAPKKETAKEGTTQDPAWKGRGNTGT